MIVKLETYKMTMKKVVYLDTEKIWSFSFMDADERVIFEANGKIILDRLISPNNSDEFEFYFKQYENLKKYFTGEGLEYNPNL